MLRSVPLAIEHHPELGRFQTSVDGQLCVADYVLRGNVMLVTHTGVPPSLEGRGIAGLLVEALLDHARTHRLTVRPLCSYAAAYMRRHPESQSLLAAH